MDAALVVRHHIVTPPEPDSLLQHLLQLCTYHIEVRPLASGRSGAVSGEVCIFVPFFMLRSLPKHQDMRALRTWYGRYEGASHIS
jgi:hypothetical protein